jgi:hypothetical protein
MAEKFFRRIRKDYCFAGKMLIEIADEKQPLKYCVPPPIFARAAFMFGFNLREFDFSCARFTPDKVIAFITVGLCCEYF